MSWVVDWTCAGPGNVRPRPLLVGRTPVLLKARFSAGTERITDLHDLRLRLIGLIRLPSKKPDEKSGAQC